MQNKVNKPEWLKKKIIFPNNENNVHLLIKDYGLNTVCEEAKCPNRNECYGKGSATFLILGNVCTRNCNFCAIEKERTPEKVNDEEPDLISDFVNKLKLRHVVITSVTRDDLSDGGAKQFVLVIKKIREKNPNTTIEVLTPDFNGNWDSVKEVVVAGPDIYNHNLEVVPRLYSKVRPMADYNLSLEVLRKVKEFNENIFTKSGIMVGLGEKKEEVRQVMLDLRSVGCDIFTVGQYLRPSKKQLPVEEYIHPDLFEYYKNLGYELGFKYVASGAYIRSSFNADEFFNQIRS